MNKFLMPVSVASILLGCSGVQAASLCSDPDVTDTVARIWTEKFITPTNRLVGDLETLKEVSPDAYKSTMAFASLAGASDLDPQLKMKPDVRRYDIANIITTDKTEYKTSCKAQYTDHNFSYTVEKTDDGRNYVDITFSGETIEALNNLNTGLDNVETSIRLIPKINAEIKAAEEKQKYQTEVSARIQRQKETKAQRNWALKGQGTEQSGVPWKLYLDLGSQHPKGDGDFSSYSALIDYADKADGVDSTMISPQGVTGIPLGRGSTSYPSTLDHNGLGLPTADQLAQSGKLGRPVGGELQSGGVGGTNDETPRFHSYIFDVVVNCKTGDVTMSVTNFWTHMATGKGLSGFRGDVKKAELNDKNSPDGQLVSLGCDSFGVQAAPSPGVQAAPSPSVQSPPNFQDVPGTKTWTAPSPDFQGTPSPNVQAAPSPSVQWMIPTTQETPTPTVQEAPSPSVRTGPRHWILKYQGFDKNGGVKLPWKLYIDTNSELHDEENTFTVVIDYAENGVLAPHGTHSSIMDVAVNCETGEVSASDTNFLGHMGTGKVIKSFPSSTVTKDYDPTTLWSKLSTLGACHHE